MAYDPPIGIPAPVDFFGAFGDIDQPTPAWPASWTDPEPSATTDKYYIDKTAPGATDTANPYGYPGKARLTFPSSLSFAAGTFIYCHAGTYTVVLQDWRGVGTAANPIWLTGNPTVKPILTQLQHFGRGATGEAHYWVFENFELSGADATIQLRPTTNGQNISHILIRNIKLHQTQTVADDGGILVGISTSAADPAPDSTITDVVIYNNEIYDIGVRSDGGTDSAGVYNGFHTNRVWVLDNLIYNIGADSVAGSHYSNYTTKLTERYYIGRNTLYGNGENGIDLKAVRYGVISQNVVYGPFQREQGYGMILHYGDATAFHCRDCAVIFNLIFHVSGGIGTGSSGVDSCFFIGNVIYDVRASYGFLSDPLNGFTIQSVGTASGSNSVQYFVNNTFYDYDRGLVLEPNTGDQFICYGNIFSQRWTSSLKNDIEVESGKESMVSLNYNLYDNPTTKIFWNNGVRNIAYMQSQGQEANAVQGDPDFINGPSANFNLLVGSPAIGGSIEGAAYAAYEAMFGVAIEVDYNNNPRPFDGSWDIGAFEYGAGPVPTPPDAPTDLTLVAVS